MFNIQYLSRCCTRFKWFWCYVRWLVSFFFINFAVIGDFASEYWFDFALFSVVFFVWATFFIYVFSFPASLSFTLHFCPIFPIFGLHVLKSCHFSYFLGIIRNFKHFFFWHFSQFSEFSGNYLSFIGIFRQFMEFFGYFWYFLPISTFFRIFGWFLIVFLYSFVFMYFFPWNIFKSNSSYNFPNLHELHPFNN